MSTEGWHHKLGSRLTGGAIIDRIVHNCHHITINGEISMRERTGISAHPIEDKDA